MGESEGELKHGGEGDQEQLGSVINSLTALDPDLFIKFAMIEDIKYRRNMQILSGYYRDEYESQKEWETLGG